MWRTWVLAVDSDMLSLAVMSRTPWPVTHSAKTSASRADKPCSRQKASARASAWAGAGPAGAGVVGVSAVCGEVPTGSPSSSLLAAPSRTPPSSPRSAPRSEKNSTPATMTKATMRKR